MLWTLLLVLLVFWLMGLIAHVGGALVHLLLVLVVLMFLAQIIAGRRILL